MAAARAVLTCGRVFAQSAASYSTRSAGKTPLTQKWTVLQQTVRQNARRYTTGQGGRAYVWPATAVGVACGLAVGTTLYLSQREKPVGAKSVPTFEHDQTPGGFRTNLPEFSLSEVAKHKTKNERVWITYKSGVYDITEFLESHPGGASKIMLAAGGSVEPFWAMYAVHKENPEVFELLEPLRIGNISKKDLIEMQQTKKADPNDPFASEPGRHPALAPSSKKPFNAEPPQELLVDNYITPNELFFVRNHLPVPQVDMNKYVLTVGGEGLKKHSFTLDDLKEKFKHRKMVATIQCAGNRRSNMMEVKKIKGLSWGIAAISNAEWTGVYLSDILAHVGLSDPENRGELRHVQFEGLDLDPEKAPYGGSIPIEKALDPSGDVLLAWDMNGEPLSRDHGFPLRVIAPGIIGARQVKWLSKVWASPDESPSHWQQNDYKGFAPQVDWDSVDFKKSPAIQEYPVQSAICEPKDGTVWDDEEEVTVKGYAYSGGGREIIRVDVSADGGKTWHPTELVAKPNQGYNRTWAWTLWEASVPLPKDAKGKKVELCAKAVDSAYNTQPESFKPYWNLRGVVANAWHRVHITVEPPEGDDD
ncbi:sulfite oxidase-like [Branchiostoma floridae x Branchiostoma japonicum]